VKDFKEDYAKDYTGMFGLKIHDNDSGVDVATVLSQGKLINLTSLDLSFTQIRVDGVTALSQENLINLTN
jgi:hypothetical protein